MLPCPTCAPSCPRASTSTMILRFMRSRAVVAVRGGGLLFFWFQTAAFHGIFNCRSLLEQKDQAANLALTKAADTEAALQECGRRIAAAEDDLQKEARARQQVEVERDMLLLEVQVIVHRSSLGIRGRQWALLRQGRQCGDQPPPATALLLICKRVMVKNTKSRALPGSL